MNEVNKVYSFKHGLVKTVLGGTSGKREKMVAELDHAHFLDRKEALLAKASSV